MIERANSYKIALVIDDIVTIPPLNGVTQRFMSIAQRLCQYPEIICLVADRGRSDVEGMRRCGFRGIVFPSTWLYNEDDFQVLINLLRPFGINILHICNAHTMVPLYGFRLAGALGARIVCDMHDIDADLVGRRCDRTRADALALQVAIADDVDNICVMSSVDLGKLSSLGVEKSKLFYSPNGIDSIILGQRSPKRRLSFIGNLFYPPNSEAVAFYLQEMLPRLRRKGVGLDIIGPAPKALSNRFSQRGICFHGPLISPSSVLQQSTAGIAPLQTGSGMKLKVLEFARHALPVVCTSIAASGFPPHRGLIVADDPRRFVQHALKLIQHPIRARRLGRALARDYTSQLSWNLVVQRLLEHYAELGAPGARPHQTLSREGAVTYRGRQVPRPGHLDEQRYLEASAFQVKRPIFL